MLDKKARAALTYETLELLKPVFKKFTTSGYYIGIPNTVTIGGKRQNPKKQQHTTIVTSIGNRQFLAYVNIYFNPDEVLISGKRNTSKYSKISYSDPDFFTIIIDTVEDELTYASTNLGKNPI